MKVLVTGGVGYIGSHAVRALLARGDDVSIVDNLSTGHRDFAPAGVFFEELDIRNEQGMMRVFHDRRPDAVMHFAALALVGEDRLRAEEYRAVNVGGTETLLKAMRSAGTSRFVFSSTCAVYGIAGQEVIDESVPLAPISVYGETKQEMEKAAFGWSRETGGAATAFRYFNAAGASATGEVGERHRPETHLIPRAIRASLNPDAEPLTIFGVDYPTPDGSAIRDYVHVEDLAAAHVAALELSKSDIINLGTERGASVLEIAALVEKVTGKEVRRRVGARREGDPARLVASIGKARALLGWSPLRNLEDIIRTAVCWEKRENSRSLQQNSRFRC